MKTPSKFLPSFLISLLSITTTIPLALAFAAPEIPGFALTWSDSFNGTAGSPASPSNWQYETPAQNKNGEIQTYTNSPLNANLSNSSTLYITPIYSPSTQSWTSARLSTHQSWGCKNGAEMILQAKIKLGQNDPINQQGFWPAFWALGDTFKRDDLWPNCGEWDIMEFVNGANWNRGSIHWGSASWAQALSSPDKYFDRKAWHTYGVRVSRKGDWFTQSITWELDGEAYHTVTGADVGSYEGWVSLVGGEYFVILNIAVGGTWPGEPTGLTWGGSGSGMEVGFVGVYNSVSGVREEVGMGGNGSEDSW